MVGIIRSKVIFVYFSCGKPSKATIPKISSGSTSQTSGAIASMLKKGAGFPPQSCPLVYRTYLPFKTTGLLFNRVSYLTLTSGHSEKLGKLPRHTPKHSTNLQDIQRRQNMFQKHDSNNFQNFPNKSKETLAQKYQSFQSLSNYFTSSDPHHDISKQLVDTTFVWSVCHGTLAQPTIPIICFTWQVIVHVSLSNRI